jgi:hypothetical protein
MGQMLGVQYMTTGTIGQVGKIMTMSLKIVSVATGEIMSTVSEDCECSIEDVLSQSTVKIAKKLDQAILRTMYAGIAVETQPSGAMVSLNGAMYGETPFSTQALTEGAYRLQITKPGYVPVSDSFVAAKGSTVTRLVKLELTKEARDSLRALAVRDSLKKVAVQDSIKRVEKQRKLRKKIVRETIISMIGAGIAGGGVGVNAAAMKTISQKQSLVDGYNTASSNFADYKQKINDKQKTINNLLLVRNIFYGAAGAVGLVVLITIPF